MDPLTFEAVTRNPALIRALMTQAHRERAEAVHRLIVEPIMSLFTLGDHHATRTDLAAARKG
jgi:hypothetical protein